MPAPRLRTRPLLAAMLVVAVCIAWSLPTKMLHLLLLRELYRVGERVGITTVYPAAGSRLAGQILGFNYSQPPAWWGFAAAMLAAVGWLAPPLAAGLWLRRRVASGRRLVPTRSLAVWMRGAVSVTVGALVGAVVYRLFMWPMFEACIWIGERLGGSVPRISGQIGMTPRGPFTGATWADDVGNLLTRHGPYAAMAAVAGLAAAIIHARLWQSDLARAAEGRCCARCGYDLRGTPPGAPCPECGTR